MPEFTIGRVEYAPPEQFEQVKDYVQAVPLGPAGPIMRAAKVGQALTKQRALAQALRKPGEMVERMFSR